MNIVRCRFCDREVDRARISAHYRYVHRRNDLDRVNHRRHRRQIRRSDISRVSVRNLPDLPNALHPPSPRGSPSPLDNCLMCLEDHHTRLLPCEHSSSCGDCLMRWWQESYQAPRCPVCRTETETVTNRGRPTTVLRDWRAWRVNDIRESSHPRSLRRYLRHWMIQASLQ